jgi:hypothetical protein
MAATRGRTEGNRDLPGGSRLRWSERAGMKTGRISIDVHALPTRSRSCIRLRGACDLERRAAFAGDFFARSGYWERSCELGKRERTGNAASRHAPRRRRPALSGTARAGGLVACAKAPRREWREFGPNRETATPPSELRRRGVTLARSHVELGEQPPASAGFIRSPRHRRLCIPQRLPSSSSMDSPSMPNGGS